MENKLKDKTWKVLKSEYLSREPWFTTRRDHVRLPNGNEIPDYYVMEYPDWVNTIAITKTGQFVFVNLYRHGLQETLIELCAGVVEKEDESPLISAQRELMEETGYGNGKWQKLMEIATNPGTHTNKVHCFLATDVEPLSEQNLEPTEDITVHLLSLDEVKAALLNDEFKQAYHAAPLWKYLAQNKLI